MIVAHDPQPAGILAAHGVDGTRWIWRCHIDTAQPNPDVWRFMRRFLDGYHAAVFTMDEFVPADLPINPVVIIPPAIDPLSPKNLPLAPGTARQVLEWIGVAFDPEAFEAAKATKRIRRGLPDWRRMQ